MKSIYLRAAFAVVTIQFESSSSAPTEPGLQWMGSVTNTGKRRINAGKCNGILELPQCQKE